MEDTEAGVVSDLYERAVLAALTGLLANPNRGSNDHVAEAACDYADQVVMEVHRRRMEAQPQSSEDGPPLRLGYQFCQLEPAERRRVILRTLRGADGRVTLAALDLKCHRNTVYYHMKQLGIVEAEYLSPAEDKASA